MPRTPDRFEKTVRRAARKDEWGMPVLDSNEVIDLLRAEHRRMVRIVKSRQRYALEDGMMVPNSNGDWIIASVLEELLT